MFVLAHYTGVVATFAQKKMPLLWTLFGF